MIHPTASQSYRPFNSSSLLETAPHTRPLRGAPPAPTPSKPASTNNAAKGEGQTTRSTSKDSSAQSSKFSKLSKLSFRDYPIASGLLAAGALVGGGVLAGYLAYPDSFNDLSSRLVVHFNNACEGLESFSNMALEALGIR